jgi:uncharacterized protein (DUF362 family)
MKPISNHKPKEKKPFSRRQFLTRAGAMAGFTAGLGYMSFAPEKFPFSLRDSRGLRSLPEPDTYHLRDFSIARDKRFPEIGIGREGRTGVVLRKALEAIGGLKRFIAPGDVVLVKPNAAFDRSPNLGATTHPEIISELIQMLYKDCRAAEVKVADNPIESPADCFAKSGIKRAAERAGARIYLPDANAFRSLYTPNATLIKNWSFFHRPFRNVTKVIGLAPVKDHNLCGASLGIKNWYGLLGGKRNQFHQDIHEIVSDLAVMIKPTLTILDGTRVLMRNGPTGGIPTDVQKKQTIVAGTDPVALDAWAVIHLLERGGELPEYLMKAESKGAGLIDPSGRIREVV